MKTKLAYLILLSAFSVFQNKVKANDTSYHAQIVVIKEIKEFDYFFMIRATLLSDNYDVKIFSLRKEAKAIYSPKISVNDTLRLCLLEKQVLEIAPGYPIANHLNAIALYKGQAVLTSERMFVSRSLYNLFYVCAKCPD